MSPLGIPQEKDISLRMMFVGLIYKTRTVLYEQTVIALEASSFFFLSYVSCMSLSGFLFPPLPGTLRSFKHSTTSRLLIGVW